MAAASAYAARHAMPLMPSRRVAAPEVALYTPALADASIMPKRETPANATKLARGAAHYAPRQAPS